MQFKILFLTFILTSTVFAQERATISKNKEDRDTRKEVSQRSIQELKEGVLLVRLDFQQRRIDYFEKYNNHKEVERVKAKQKKVNDEIRDAFNTYYTFSEVYYFAMSDSRKLLDGKLDSVTFYNGEGNVDSSLDLEEKDYYIAEFAFVEQDTATYYSGSAPTPNNPDNPEGKTYYGGSKNGRSALVIRNAKFQQLRHPFPYYAAYSYFGLVKKRYRLPVRKINSQLNNYLAKAKHVDGSE